MSYEPSLFDPPDAMDHGQAAPLKRLRDIGVVYETAFLHDEECRRLLASIDERPWLYDLKRRVQHYGWKYDYASRFVTKDMQVGPLPDFIRDVAARLRERGWFYRTPDQVIVNEYDPAKKQGISPHVDRECFGPTVATLSLGDAWPMEFAATDWSRQRVSQEKATQEKATQEKIELVLDVGSILVLTGDARSKWTHGIAPRQTEPDRSTKSTNPCRTPARIPLTFQLTTRIRSASEW